LGAKYGALFSWFDAAFQIALAFNILRLNSDAPRSFTARYDSQLRSLFQSGPLCRRQSALEVIKELIRIHLLRDRESVTPESQACKR
jgi:hypothetical protein